MTAGEGAGATVRSEQLGRAGVSGVTWQTSSYVLGKLLVLGTTVVLARLLAPTDFGLVALALVFVSYADVVADLGVAQALIFLPRSAQTSRAGVAAAVGSGLCLVLLAWVSAGAVAAFFHEPQVAPLFRLLSVSLLAGTVASVPEALLRRELMFRRLTVAALVRSLVIGAVSITLAVAGTGAWSIAWGTVAGAVVYMVLTWVLAPHGPDLKLWLVRRDDLVPVLRFGLSAAGGALLAKLIVDCDYLIVGRALGVEALAFYTMAFRLPELLIINMFFVVSSVTYPLYSRARHEPERLRRGYLTSVRLQAVYGLGTGATLAVVAPALVAVGLGSQWGPSIAPLVALSIYAAVRSLAAGTNEVYKALGRPGLTVRLGLVRLAVVVPSLLLATQAGIVAVAWAQVGLAAIFAVVTQTVALRVLGLSAVRFVRGMLPALVGAVAAAAGGLLGSLVGDGRLTTLLSGVAAAVVAALLALRLSAPRLLGELWALWRGRGRAMRAA